MKRLPRDSKNKLAILKIIFKEIETQKEKTPE